MHKSPKLSLFGGSYISVANLVKPYLYFLNKILLCIYIFAEENIQLIKHKYENQILNYLLKMVYEDIFIQHSDHVVINLPDF